MTPEEKLRRKRWRLVLGDSAEKDSGNFEQPNFDLTEFEQGLDDVLKAVYESERKAGLGASAPHITKWLNDIRKYFPSTVVRLVQKDAFERLKLQKMLLQPEFLESVEADIHLVGTLLALKNVIPEKSKEVARLVVRKLVNEIESQIRLATITAVQGALSQVKRSSNPKHNEIDWNLTIRANLKNYLHDYQTIVPEKLIGHQRQRFSLRDLILCVDQSGSMSASVIYASIFGAVLASLRALRTRFIVFDTEVVDLSEHLQDPVDLLFGTQLGGGTDIARALTYCQQQVERPENTILVLISDLFEGGDRQKLLKRCHELVESGVLVICLLALADTGRSGFCERTAQELTNLGIVTFACTPDQFPDLMVAAIKRQDLQQWAAKNEIVLRQEQPVSEDISGDSESSQIIL